MREGHLLAAYFDDLLTASWDDCGPLVGAEVDRL
jgi:hypothetical protein